VNLSDSQLQFLQDHHSAAMITTTPDGVAKAARVVVALVDGRMWSSGTQDRVRTKRLRRDPRCTLFVFDDTGFAWLALETTVDILDGPDAANLNLQLFRQMQGKPTGELSWFGGSLSEKDFLRTMASEGRLIYQFAVDRAYGLTSMA